MSDREAWSGGFSPGHMVDMPFSKGADDALKRMGIPPILPPTDPERPTLRDQFAMAALDAVHHPGGRYGPDGLKGVAEAAYAVADAMMAERRRAPPPALQEEK